MKLAQAESPVGAEAAPSIAEGAVSQLVSADDAFARWQVVADWLVLGGPVVWILIALATIALTIILLKVWQFIAVGVERARPVNQALAGWQGGDPSLVIEQLQGRQDPTSQVVLCALSGLERAYPDDVIREECQRLANGQLERLRSLLRPLAFIGTTSPLLGLLGTVIGMIAAFQGIEQAGSQVDPGVLSGGIWAALLTTAVGLSVAIPVTVAHAWLERKLERLAHRIEDSVSVVFTARLRRALATDFPGLKSASRDGPEMIAVKSGGANDAASA